MSKIKEHYHEQIEAGQRVAEAKDREPEPETKEP
jgi:hypothetical protein